MKVEGNVWCVSNLLMQPIRMYEFAFYFEGGVCLNTSQSWESWLDHYLTYNENSSQGKYFVVKNLGKPEIV